MTFLIIASISLLVLAVLAIVAYRAKRTMGFWLLMLAAICFTLPRIGYLGTGFLSYTPGWEAGGGLHGWLQSYLFIVFLSGDFLFVGLLIAALAFFIRERKEIVTPHP